MLKLRKPNKVPSQGGYKYFQKETNTTFIRPSFRNIVKAAQEHTAANSLKVPTEQEILENVCEQRPELCFNDESPGFFTQVGTAYSAMVEFAKKGFPLATKETLEYRLSICQTCSFWGGSQGGTFFDGKCGKCGCKGIKLALDTSTCPISKWAIMFLAVHISSNFFM